MVAPVKFDVLDRFRDTERWLDDVRRASDTHRNELGFLPQSVFKEFARKDGLFVLVAKEGDGPHYAGHLLFDRHFPRAHIRHMFTSANYRRRGAASLLLEHLRQSLTQSSFISIYARVAEDLQIANKFWDQQRFYIQRSERGGASRKRQILVRCLELESPQLIPPSGLDEHNPLGLVTPAADDLPMFLLDMNVLFDVNPRRLRRTEVVGLFQAERMNFCRLAISSEVREELQRNVLNQKHTDPMAAYVDTFPCIPVDNDKATDELFSNLSSLVFPSSPLGLLTPSERSDLRHVITAVRNDLTGLITNDNALLDAAPAIEAKYGIRILSSGSFEADASASSDGETFHTVEKETLRLLKVSEDAATAVRAMLRQKVHLTGSEIAISWLPVETQGKLANRAAVWSDTTCIGYVIWPGWGLSDVVNVRAAVDESHTQGLDAARILLLHVIDHLRNSDRRQVRLELPPHQSYLREVAAGIGFVGNPKNSSLIKSILGAALTPSTWTNGQTAMAANGGPRLPLKVPLYRGIDQQIEVLTPDGNRVHVSLDKLESLLSPLAVFTRSSSRHHSCAANLC